MWIFHNLTDSRTIRGFSETVKKEKKFMPMLGFRADGKTAQKIKKIKEKEVRPSISNTIFMLVCEALEAREKKGKK